MKPALKLENVSKRFGAHTVLKGVSFSVAPAEVIALVGSSGSGKTTLLRCLNHLVPINEGTIDIAGFTILPHNETLDVRSLREKVGMVFQQYNLWPHKTVRENLMEAPLLVKKMTQAAAKKSAELLLAQIGLTNKKDAYPAILSGGQQQRVAIARALMMEPEILLLDEVTSALDPELTVEVLALVRSIAEEHKRTLIFVTHEIGFVQEIADRMIFLDQGAIVEEGTPDELLTHPHHPRTKQFLERFLKH